MITIICRYQLHSIAYLPCDNASLYTGAIIFASLFCHNYQIPSADDKRLRPEIYCVALIVLPVAKLYRSCKFLMII